MGWDKRRVVTYIDRGSFPEPLTSLASGGSGCAKTSRRFADDWRTVMPPARRRQRRARPRRRRPVTERRLYLIRHGRADYDSADRRPPTPRGEQYDPPLGDVGLRAGAAARATGSAAARGRRPLYSLHACAGRARRRTSTPSATGLDVIVRDDLCEWFGGGVGGEGLRGDLRASTPRRCELFRNQNPVVAPRARGRDRARTSSARA